MKIEQYNYELFAQYPKYFNYLKYNSSNFEDKVGKSHVLQVAMLNWVLDTG